MHDCGARVSGKSPKPVWKYVRDLEEEVYRLRAALDAAYFIIRKSKLNADSVMESVKDKGD